MQVGWMWFWRHRIICISSKFDLKADKTSLHPVYQWFHRGCHWWINLLGDSIYLLFTLLVKIASVLPLINSILIGFPWWLKTVKNLPAMQENYIWSLSQEDPLEKGMATHSNPLQYSCLENSMDIGVWLTTVYGVTKSWSWLRDYHFSLAD